MSEVSAEWTTRNTANQAEKRHGAGNMRQGEA